MKTRKFLAGLLAFGLQLAAPSAPAGSAWSYLHKPDSWFAGPEAKGLAANILSYQSPEGSWPKNIDTTAKAYTGDREKLKGTFDNGATTGELRFLGKVCAATHDTVCQRAVSQGLDLILKAQYPTGGWPQFYPPPARSYHRHITFNDNTMVRLMEWLREVAANPDYAFVDEGRRRAAREAFDRGVQCILLCQVWVNGRLTGWCAQHDEVTFEPRPARTFELVSLSGAESVGIVRLLMSLKDPSSEVVQSVEAAVKWFKAVELHGIKVVSKPDSDTPKGYDRIVVHDPAAETLWARFYEIGTNKPFFSGRDGVKKYHLSEIEYERRNGYAWLGTWPQRLLETEYPAWEKARMENGQ